MDPGTSVQLSEGVCECGIIFEDISKKELLQKIIKNSSGDKIPCKMCVYRLTECETSSSEIHCFSCNVIFPCSDTLYSHILEFHIPSQPYKCEHCEEAFKLIEFFKIHGLNSCYAGSSGFLCQICGESYFDSDEYEEHMKVHENNKYPCPVPVCKRKFPTNAQMQIHVRNSHKKSKSQVPTMMECVICNDLIAEDELNTHMKMKHGTGTGTSAEEEDNSLTVTRKYDCFLCDMSFFTAGRLSNHLKIKHNGEKLFMCKTCPKAFGSEKELKLHLADIHPGVATFHCNICGLYFKKMYRLKSHQQIHLERDPFVCGICGSTYFHRKSLNRHQREHHNYVENEQDTEEEVSRSEEVEEYVTEELSDES